MPHAQAKSYWASELRISSFWRVSGLEMTATISTLPASLPCRTILKEHQRCRRSIGILPRNLKRAKAKKAEIHSAPIEGSSAIADGAELHQFVDLGGPPRKWRYRRRRSRSSGSCRRLRGGAPQEKNHVVHIADPLIVLAGREDGDRAATEDLGRVPRHQGRRRPIGR